MKPHERGRQDRPRSGTQGQAPGAQQQKLLSEQDIRDAIRLGGKPLVEAAEVLGPRLKDDGLTTSQIRNVYGLVKQMEMRGFNPNELVLLKPKLAYAAARANPPHGARLLRDVLSQAVDEVGTDEPSFGRFVDFFEAILAYHKAAGGRS
jgi:CRISPR-associated protein Csm2